MLDTTLIIGDTRHLISVVRLTKMNAATRSCTIQSIRTVRREIFGGIDVSVDAFAATVVNADRETRTKLGERHSQLLSDCARALRAWAHEPRRALACRLGDQMPFLSDAVEAVWFTWGPDKAKRAEAAIVRLSASESTTPDNLQATAIMIEPLLRHLAPEDLGLSALKSVGNACGLIRAAVALVDPNATSSREADIETLSDGWKAVLQTLKPRIPDHAKSVTAIFRRLAIWCDRRNVGAEELLPELVAEFLDHELATKSDNHAEKLRSASRIWTTAVEENAMDAGPFDFRKDRSRLPDVKWSEVPTGIRERFDALTSKIQAPQGDVQWSTALTADVDTLDAELGIAGMDCDDTDTEADMLMRDVGTIKNWQDSVKRVWHAAAQDDSVINKPSRLEDLFRRDCVLAVVRAIRSARRMRVEAEGRKWEGNEKGRYETSLVQTFIAVGRALHLADDVLEPLVELTYKLDPSIIGSKLQADGTRKLVYEDRKIGPQHAEMLSAFSDVSVLRRWFEAPGFLWAKATRPIAKAKKRTINDAALARSALILQIEQRVCPMRRINLARLRIDGDDPHITLPVGGGEGSLRLPAGEVKNLRTVHVRIDPDTVRMIREFYEKFRPICMKHAKADPENEHLFPGRGRDRKERGRAGGYPLGKGYFTATKLNSTFSKHMWKHFKINIDLQVMRHIAGKVILDQDPSAMSLVQELLAHKRIETTRAYYAEVCGFIAQERYLDLLDKATRKALATVSFRVELEKTMEDKK